MLDGPIGPGVFTMTHAYLNRIATAVPEHDVHQAFVTFASGMLEQDRVRKVFNRMASRSGIESRFSVLSPVPVTNEFDIDAHEFYRRGTFPGTARRMGVFEGAAPRLAHRALDRLALTEDERRGITHVLVTSCTGLYAPGLDFEIGDYLGLAPSVERTMIGFMGCYAAINALKLARHIVRSETDAKVLVVNLELCTLHLQETQDLEQVLSFLVFADGCAASLVTGDEIGLRMDGFRAVVIPETRGLITWRIRELGFDMLLSGEVPKAIGRSLRGVAGEITAPRDPGEIELWAVHPGGKSVLDAVEQGLGLGEDALEASREVLCRYGNMSSATVMFVLAETMRTARCGQVGCAMSFGRGLTA